MQDSDSLEGYLDNCAEEAMRWYQDRNMRNMIHKIISQIRSYNRVCEEEDYWAEAFLALQVAVIKYSEFRKYSLNVTEEDEEVFNFLSKNPSMKFRTFAYWYLQKRLYRLADMGDVEFVVEADGDEKTVSAQEYYKNRHRYNGSAKSIRRVYSFSEFDNEKESRKYEPVDYEDLLKIKRNCRRY